MRNLFWTAYWSYKFVGCKLDVVKFTLKGSRWHFVVRNGTYTFSDPKLDKWRLHMYTDESIGRVKKVRIG